MPTRPTREIDVQMLHRLLICDAEAGRLIWRERVPEFFSSQKRDARSSAATWNAKFAGREAFTTCERRGPFRGSIFGRNYLKHRVIWAMHFGAWPTNQIDHINGIPGDNRIVNLRDATHSQNASNRASLPGSVSRFIGVWWCPQTQKWAASVAVGRKKFYAGRHASEIDAARARDTAALRLKGEFARLNFPELAQQRA